MKLVKSQMQEQVYAGGLKVLTLKEIGILFVAAFSAQLSFPAAFWLPCETLKGIPSSF